jgi:hypothetical protein
VNSLSHLQLNLEALLAKMWDYMGLIRVYTKKRGQPPDFSDPLVLSSERRGTTVEVRWLRCLTRRDPGTYPGEMVIFGSLPLVCGGLLRPHMLKPPPPRP